MIAGQQLGPYEIRQEIGKGGMAVVYRAYQPTVDRDVAIKVILKGIAGDPAAIQRFQREARLIARLEHPHILPVYDFDGAHDPPYIVMRYLDGGTLKDVISQGLLPHDEIAYLMRQVCSALDYAHRQGIAHRDVKPSNILVDREGNAFVSDFGIARLTSGEVKGGHITETGTVVGTPDYMSPEQATGEPDIDQRTDVYALGVMLFEMLTGQLPYQGASGMKVLSMHLSTPIPSARALKPELPGAVDELIFWAMAKERSERCLSAADLSAAIMAALGGTFSAAPIRLREAAETSTTRRLSGEKVSTDSKATPSEHNKQVTALYANAAEYAALVSQSAGVEAAHKAIGRLWESFERLVTERGGRVFSHAEDTMLAVWGVDAAHEDDAERAVQAALAMQDALRQQAATFLESADDLLPLNIGLNSGLALLTPGEQTGTYSASGGTISFANRLAQNAEGVLLITYSTYRQVRGVFDMQPDVPLKVRGAKEPIPTYRVLAAKTRAFRVGTRGIEGIETRLVGRESELKLLQNAFLNAIEDRETQVVTLVGEAGIGKSRLLYEFDQWVDLRPERCRLFQGRATSAMSGRPFALIRDMMSLRFGILDSDPAGRVLSRMASGVAELVGQNDEMAHLTGHLCGFDCSDSPHVKGLLGDPEQLNQRARQLFVRLFTTLAKQQPVLIELDDIHFADDASLDLLNDLFAADEHLPLMAVGLARPALYDRRGHWGSGQPYHTRLDLQPLDRRGSRDLVAEILQKAGDAPKPLRDLLVERAEGNPYFLEELVKMLLDDRVIIKESDDHWRIEESRLGALDVPSTLLGLLEARFDTLLYPEKLTLQRASVIGRIFYDTALQTLDSADETHLSDGTAILAKLVERGFIYKRETSAFAGSVEYIFDSTLLRDAVYGALLQRQISAYNRAAAEWFIVAAGARADEYAAQIANHFQVAGDSQRAGEILLVAGERAISRSAYPDGIQLLERARDLLPEDGRALLRLGEAHFLIADYPNAGALLEAARNAASRDAANGGPLRATALAVLGEITIQAGDYPAARQLLEEGLLLARANSEPAALLRNLCGLGRVYNRLDEFDRSHTVLVEALAVARQAGEVSYELTALATLGGLALELRDADEAERLGREGLALARQTGNRRSEETFLQSLGIIAADLLGDFSTAIVYLEQALVIAREIGGPLEVGFGLLNISDVEIRLRRLESARQHAIDGLKVLLEIGSWLGVGASLLVFARLAAWRGDTDRALALIGLAKVHPTFSPDSQRVMDDLLRDMALPDDVVQAGLEKGAALDFDATVRDLLENA